MTNTYIAIDPGSHGGIVCLYYNGKIGFKKLPETREDIFRAINTFMTMDRTYRQDTDSCIMCIEKVKGFMGGKREGGKFKNQASAHTMFTFGQYYERCLCQIERAGFMEDDDYFLVEPKAWQKKVGCRSKKKGEDKTSWKNYLASYARKLFPRVKITLNVADAFLIAKYAQLTYEPTLTRGQYATR